MGHGAVRTRGGVRVGTITIVRLYQRDRFGEQAGSAGDRISSVPAVCGTGYLSSINDWNWLDATFKSSEPPTTIVEADHQAVGRIRAEPAIPPFHGLIRLGGYT